MVEAGTRGLVPVAGDGYFEVLLVLENMHNYTSSSLHLKNHKIFLLIFTFLNLLFLSFAF